MPTDDELRAAELKRARAEGRAEALEELEAKRRQEQDDRRPARSRLSRGLAATDPTRKENHE